MSTIKMLFAVSVLASLVYVGAKIIPVYMGNYQFQDAIKSEATLETYTNKTENDIRASIFHKAQGLEIPIAEEAIEVHRQGMIATGSISIRAPYVVHVDLPGYPLDLHFDPSTQNRGVF